MFAVLPAIGTLLVSLWLMIPNSPQIFGKAVHSISTKEKVVALTYDDGPVPGFTNDILNVLQKHDIKATFFVIGQRAEKNPDLVFLDLGMPDGSGFHAIRNIKKINDSAKIIPVTGKNDYSTKEKLNELNIHEVIFKPIDMDKLMDLV